MVAAPEYSNSVIGFETNILTKPKDLRTLAAERGHEEWKKTTENRRFHCGFPDNPNAKIRSGLVPFDLILGLRNKIGQIDNPSKIDDSFAINFVELILSEARNGRILFKPEFEKELRELIRGKNELVFLDLVDIKNWIFELDSKWFHKNDNWSDNAEAILNTMQRDFGSLDNISSKEEIQQKLEEIREKLNNLKHARTPLEMRRILSDKEVLNLLILIHGGWRKEKHKMDKGIKGPFSFENSIFNLSWNKFKEVVTNIIKFTYPLDFKIIKGQLDDFKFKIEKIPGMSSENTFELMLQMAEFIEEQEKSSKMEQSKKALQDSLNYILDTIKYDANTALIDSIIDYINIRL